MVEVGPRVLSLALHYELPVITTRVGHTIDLLRDNVNCKFVPKKDPKAISREIISLLNDKKRRNKFIKRGYKIAQENTWPKKIDEWIYIFNNAINKIS